MSVLGLKRKNIYIQTPWMTNDIIQTKIDLDNFYKDFKSFSKRKEKHYKNMLNALKDEQLISNHICRS